MDLIVKISATYRGGRPWTEDDLNNPDFYDPETNQVIIDSAMLQPDSYDDSFYRFDFIGFRQPL